MNGPQHKDCELQISEDVAKPEVMRLRLYVAGGSPNSVNALINLKTICQNHANICFEVDVVDIWLEPGRALVDGILVTPTLHRPAPLPEVKIIGDLSDMRAVTMALGLEGVQA